MGNSFKSNYVKRTQKDYSLGFKLQVVSEIEHGELSTSRTKKKYGIQGSFTVVYWIRKYGNLRRELEVKFAMGKSPE